MLYRLRASPSPCTFRRAGRLPLSPRLQQSRASSAEALLGTTSHSHTEPAQLVSGAQIEAAQNDPAQGGASSDTGFALSRNGEGSKNSDKSAQKSPRERKPTNSRNGKEKPNQQGHDGQGAHNVGSHPKDINSPAGSSKITDSPHATGENLQQTKSKAAQVVKQGGRRLRARHTTSRGPPMVRRITSATSGVSTSLKEALLKTGTTSTVSQPRMQSDKASPPTKQRGDKVSTSRHEGGRGKTLASQKEETKARSPPQKDGVGTATPLKKFEKGLVRHLSSQKLQFNGLKVDQPPVPKLSHGLDRVLFNPGVYRLRDPRSLVYNFDPYLEKIMPAAEFDFSALKEYVESSRDTQLRDVAEEHGTRYIGSTSSMTSVLCHFHYLLSQWRPLNIDMVSKGFLPSSTKFTPIYRAPTAIFLRWNGSSYAIDYDKEFSGANVLMKMGHTLEKLLTNPVESFERYRRSNPEQVPEEERTGKEAYHFSTLGKFLMRSQLDAYDARLPGTGMFDLKTRAVVSIRFNADDPADYTGYQLRHAQGEWESFEREYYDMIRSTLLKYSLQVRMGRMDGIFIAYHNIEQMFGFQYMSLPEMDLALHGDSTTAIGDKEFRLSLGLLEDILDRATAKYPEQSLRLQFETRVGQPPFMYIIAEPVTDEEIREIQRDATEKAIDFERKLLGIVSDDSEGSLGKSDEEEWRKLQENVETRVQNESDAPNASTLATGEDQPNDALQGSSQSSDGQPNPAAAQEPDESTDDSESSTAPEKPFMAMTLTVRNKVNRVYVERPVDLENYDEWAIEYALVELSQSKAAATRQAVRKRRLEAFTLSQSDEQQKHSDMFRQTIARYSSSGRKLRLAQEEADANREKVIFVDGKLRIEDETKRESAKSIYGIRSEEGSNVESYMDWLYLSTKESSGTSSGP